MKERESPDNDLPSMDFTELLDGLSGKWVVLSEDKRKVLYSADSLTDLVEDMDEGIVMMVPSSGTVYIPSFV